MGKWQLTSSSSSGGSDYAARLLPEPQREQLQLPRHPDTTVDCVRFLPGARARGVRKCDQIGCCQGSEWGRLVQGNRGAHGVPHQHWVGRGRVAGRRLSPAGSTCLGNPPGLAQHAQSAMQLCLGQVMQGEEGAALWAPALLLLLLLLPLLVLLLSNLLVLLLLTLMVLLVR